MSYYDDIKNNLRRNPSRWLVTGAAGFIGSHLVQELLNCGQFVFGLDDFTTGHQANLDDVKEQVGESNWSRFEFLRGSITDYDVCSKACSDISYVLHQAALGSVPRSIEYPERSHAVNVDGFVNMLLASRNAHVQRFVYASSSSVYGDSPDLPKVEDRIGAPLSPYAVTKRVNEIYAENFGLVYGMVTVGLRYFNVFGSRQDPNGAYAAVIPKWIAKLCVGETCDIYGDGETSRDFCYIENVVQANILAALADKATCANQVFNVAVGAQATLNDLYKSISNALQKRHNIKCPNTPNYKDFRSGDVRHSLANITKAKTCLLYEPTHGLSDGMDKLVDWACKHV